MASLLSSTCWRGRLFQLPPAVRTSLVQQAFRNSTPSQAFSSTQRSAFSSTARGRDLATTTEDVVNHFLDAPTHLLDGVHSLGIPWYAAIPICAIAVRGFLVYHLAVLPARKRAIIRANLVPFTEIQRKMEMRIRTRDRLAQGLRKPTRLQAFVENLRRQHSVGKAFGAPLFSPRPFINLAALYAFSEAIRIKCGLNEGLWSIISSPFRNLVSSEPSAEVAAETTAQSNMTPAELLAERLQQARDAQILRAGDVADAQDGLVSTSNMHLPPIASSYSESLDLSLKTEGLSIFPDLTMADPTWTLPFCLSALIIGNALLRVPKRSATEPTPYPHQQNPKPLVAQSSGSLEEKVKSAMDVAAQLNKDLGQRKVLQNPFDSLTNAQRLALCMGLVWFVAGVNMPAGIMLYLISSILTGVVQGRWMDLKYPIPQPIKPCKREMRLKVKADV